MLVRLGERLVDGHEKRLIDQRQINLANLFVLLNLDYLQRFVVYVLEYVTF